MFGQMAHGDRAHIRRTDGPDGRYEIELKRTGGDDEYISADTLNLNGEHPMAIEEYLELGSDPDARIRIEIRDSRQGVLAVIRPE